MKNVSKMLAGHRANIDRLASRLEAQEDNLPKIEIDLLLAELRQFYADLLNLDFPTETAESEATPIVDATPEIATPLPEKNIPDLAPLMVEQEAEPVFAKEPESQEQLQPSVQQPSIEEIEGQSNDALFEDNEPEPLQDTDPILPQPEPEPSHPEPKNIQPESTPLTQMQEHEPVAHEPLAAPKQQPSLFDYLKAGNTQQPSQRTIADSLGEVQKQRAEERINPNKVQDLRTIININDKFSFMNELFRNNMKGYNDFILKLNATTEREEALAYVQQVANQYGWDNESIAVKTFYSIFDRKF